MRSSEAGELVKFAAFQVNPLQAHPAHLLPFRNDSGGGQVEAAKEIADRARGKKKAN
jgi:hypothetical protein